MVNKVVLANALDVRRRIMANKKWDEINKLHVRLDEITFCVSEEQIDIEEIEEILDLLDELEPIDMNSPEADPEKAFQRFKERYGLSDVDFLKRT